MTKPVEAEWGAEGRARWNLAPAEPVAMQRAWAFMNPGGLEQIEMPIYPEASRADGERLRSARVEMRVGLRDASRLLGISVVEISAVERGAMTGDIGGMIIAIAAEGRAA